MINELLCLRALSESISKFTDMLTNPKFWYILIAIIGAIILLVNCLKHPKVGKWVLLGIFYIGFLCLTAYSCVKLSIHYKTRGGIFGQITGIFEPNQVKIVDDITYEFTNTELVQVDNTSRYSSSAIVQEVMDLEKGVKYQLLVNGVPCGYSDNNEDYIVAKYDYIFYDENFDILKQDVLTIKIAFYTNSTSFSVSTDGGASAVKYWNYYFNKNNFVITLTSKSVEKENEYTTGDISNFVKLTYIVNGEVYKEKTVLKGSEIDLSTPSVDKFEYWTINGEKVTSANATQDTVITAYITPEYSCDFVVLDKIEKTVVANKGDTLNEYKPTVSINNTTKYVVDYWTVEGVKVDLSTYIINTSTTFVAQGHYQYSVGLSSYYISELKTFYYWVDENTIFSTINNLQSNYVITKCTVNGVEIDANSYIVTQPITIIAEGYLQYKLTFKVNDENYSIETVKIAENGTLPANPTVEGKVFVGWSYDGHNVIEDIDLELLNISQNKTFIAVFNDELYTLTIKDHYYGEVIQTISQAIGSTYVLTVPADYYTDSTFIGWRIASGSGTVDGNTFTFSSSECTIYACFDKIKVSLGSKVEFTYTYNGETKNGYSASFAGDVNGSISVSFNTMSSYSLEIETDGTYTITGNCNIGYTVTWENASFIGIGMKSSGVIFT